ncbi:MAG: type II secretion system protein GspC [Pseudomonadota bacterium]
MAGLPGTVKQIDWVQINKRVLEILRMAWSRYHQRLPPVVNVVLVIALASYLAKLTWLAIPLPQEQGPPRAAPVLSQVTVNQAPAGGSRSLAGLHIFGQATMAPPADQLLAPYTAPETQLRLTLLGVFASTSKNSAWAIIGDQGGGEETYGVGANVPGGATVHEIMPDRVVLLRNGRYETLRLPRDGAEGDISTGGINRAPPSPMGMNGNRVYVTPEVAASLREYRTALLNDPQSVMDVLRAEPYRDGGGRLVGYRVFPGRDKQIMDRVGLRPGDVVTSVNGVPLDNPIKGLEVMRDLANASEVAVQVLRNGAVQSLVVPVN